MIFLQFIFGGLENIGAVLLVILNAKLIDEVLEQNASAFFQRLPLMAVVFLLQIIFQHLENVCVVKCKCNCGKSMRTSIYAALMNLEEDGEQKAKVMNLFNTYIGQVQEYVSQVANIGILIVTMLVASGYMIKINPLLFVVSVVCIPVFTFLYQKINVPYQEKNQKIVQGKEQLNHDIKQM